MVEAGAAPPAAPLAREYRDNCWTRVFLLLDEPNFRCVVVTLWRLAADGFVGRPSDWLTDLPALHTRISNISKQHRVEVHVPLPLLRGGAELLLLPPGDHEQVQVRTPPRPNHAVPTSTPQNQPTDH